MTTEERLNQQGGNTVSSNGESQEIVAVKSEQPPVPKGVTNEESRELKDRAADVVRQLEDASGSEALELITSITTVGTQAQRNAGTELELLRTCVGEVLTREGPGGEVSKKTGGSTFDPQPDQPPRGGSPRLFEAGIRSASICGEVHVGHEGSGEDRNTIRTSCATSHGYRDEAPGRANDAGQG